MNIRKLTMLGVAIATLVPSIGAASIHLDLRPDTQIATIGSTVNFSLYAVSDDATNQSIGAMDVNITWDPAALQLSGFTNTGNGYTWFQSGFLLPGGTNASFADGDATWTAFAQPGGPAYSTPAGLKVTTFQFQALVTNPSTVVAIPLNQGGRTTAVWDGFIPNFDVTGTLDAGAKVMIYDNMWPVTSFSVGPGMILGGSIADMQSSDNLYTTVRPGPILISSQFPIVEIASTNVPSISPTSLSLIVESAVNSANITQKIEMFNYNTSTYQLVNTQTLPTSDTTTTINIAVNASNYVDQTTGEVRARISCKNNGAVLIYPWIHRIDRIVWQEQT